jgi:hypothetical protein
LKSLLLLMGRAHEPDPNCPFNCDPCRVDQPIRPCGLFPQLPAPLPCSNPRCACARSPFSTGHTVTRPAPTGSTPPHLTGPRNFGGHYTNPRPGSLWLPCPCTPVGRPRRRSSGGPRTRRAWTKLPPNWPILQHVPLKLPNLHSSCLACSRAIGPTHQCRCVARVCRSLRLDHAVPAVPRAVSLFKTPLLLTICPPLPMPSPLVSHEIPSLVFRHGGL